MEISDLIQSLEKQKLNLERMLAAAEKKQRALVSNNNEALEASVTAEQGALMSLQQTEKERLSIMNALYRQADIRPKNLRIYELVDLMNDRMDKKTAGALLKLEEEIKETAGQISKLNQQNLYLIEHSRNFIKETLMSVLSAKKAILDRKV